MRRVLMSVEGQTEETFVREVLQPHLWSCGLHPVPVLVATKRVKVGPQFKGGLVSYQQARRDILNLLGDSAAAAVTTMYDLYRLPDDFPGYATRPAHDCYAKVAHLETELAKDIDNRRFRAYMQLHEFEALLFVAPQQTAMCFPDGDRHLSDLEAIRQRYGSPEEINDGPNTAPSVRVLSLFPTYQKPLHGPLAVLEVGLGAIRKQCRHFDAWLSWLETLGHQPHRQGEAPETAR